MILNRLSSVYSTTLRSFENKIPLAIEREEVRETPQDGCAERRPCEHAGVGGKKGSRTAQPKGEDCADEGRTAQPIGGGGRRQGEGGQRCQPGEGADRIFHILIL